MKQPNDKLLTGRRKLMLHYLIMCRSLTYAQRAARVLEQAGITAIVTKAPQNISLDGCAYCVKVSEKRLSDALYELNAAALAPGKVYLYGPGGFASEATK
jgi:rhodanese-related sulfurtransferase